MRCHWISFLFLLITLTSCSLTESMTKFINKNPHSIYFHSRYPEEKHKVIRKILNHVKDNVEGTSNDIVNRIILDVMVYGKRMGWKG